MVLVLVYLVSVVILGFTCLTSVMVMIGRARSITSNQFCRTWPVFIKAELLSIEVNILVMTSACKCI